MADVAKIFRINYKSDFILTLTSDAGWMTPFCIKFWTGAPSQAYYVGWDGETYDHCSFDPSEPTKLTVQFDDHHLPIGDLKFQVAYHFTVDDFPNDTEDEVINPANITTEIDGETYQVMLDFTGETAPEIQFALPAYANEAQRIANEQERIANEEQRIAAETIRIQNEEARISAEQTRQQNEQQRINQEQARVDEYAGLKADAVAATGAANDAATLANQKAQLAADKAALAQSAATLCDEKAALAQAAAQLANAKAQLAADKAALAASAAQLCDEKAALAQQKATYAKEQGDYSKAQGDYAKEQGDYSKEQGDYSKAQGNYSKEQGDYAKAKGDICAADHQIAVADHQTAAADHQTAQSDHTTAGNDHTQADTDHTRAENDHTRAESDHDAVELYVDSLGVFDLSKHNAVGGVLATYADLNAALTALNALESKYKYGGMSFKYVDSSDNNYVRYDLMADSFSTNVSDWQSMNADDGLAEGSGNLAKSGTVYEAVKDVVKDSYPELNDKFAIIDNNGNIAFLIDENGNLQSPTIEALTDKLKNFSFDFPDQFLICDDDGNIAFKIEKNGIIHATGLSGNSNPFKDKELYTIGDSLFCSNIWQERCASNLGCKFDPDVNLNPEYPTSAGGTNSYMKYPLSTYIRALNLIKQDVIEDDGENAIIVIGNSNDGVFEFDPDARAYTLEHTVELEELTAENLSAVDSELKTLNTAIKLPQTSIGTLLTITQLPTSEGDINLNVGWSADGHYDYRIHVVPQATQEATLAYVMERILEYDYGSTFDVEMSDNSVGFTMGGSFYPTVLFTDIGNTGMQVTTSQSDSITYYMYKWFNSDDISEWSNTAKWVDGGASCGWKSTIEELQRHYPLAQIAILNCPKIVIDMTDPSMTRANGTYNQEAFVDAISSVIEGTTARNKAIADYYQVKLIDIWAELGVSANNILSFYPASGNVHTNENGQKRWGDLIAGEIKGWIL